MFWVDDGRNGWGRAGGARRTVRADEACELGGRDGQKFNEKICMNNNIKLYNGKY